MRRIFIGDIQGCARQLDDLLAAVDLRSHDRLYCVGDLVNRGPNSLAVLRRLYQLDARIVLGNHDLHLLRHARRGTVVKASDPLHATLDAPDCDDLLAWLAAQPVMRVEDDLVAVHGGVHPAWHDLVAVARDLNDAVRAVINGGRDERVRFVTEVRYCDANGRRPKVDDPPPAPPYYPWDTFYEGTRTVVFGHWAMRGLVIGARVRGLDTGCVYGGALTAWIAESDRIVQVPGLPVSDRRRAS
ncbi:MAG TPA: metallophosphoesterase [Candidatus Binatia bacterium]|nr:metallophosphoesterase [Candidatus Binatia bacterium]